MQPGSLVCAECQSVFSKCEQLWLHSEMCVTEAFECEALTTMQPNHTNPITLAALLKADDCDEDVSVPPDEDMDNQSEHNKPSGSNDDDCSDYSSEPAQTISGAGGLSLQVSVLKPIVSGTDEPIKPKMACPTCGKILYRHNFAVHHRTHTGDLPFECTFCKKRLRTSSALKVHLRAHTQERPFECKVCWYKAMTKRNLQRHTTAKHRTIEK